MNDIMQPFLITTNGLCLPGKAIVLAKSIDNAREVFIESLKDEFNEHENKIIGIKKIETSTAKVIYYDDGNR